MIDWANLSLSTTTQLCNIFLTKIGSFTRL